MKHTLGRAAIGAALATLAALPGMAAAQDYPTRPIRLLVGYTPAGAADYVSRVFGEALSKELGQTVLVDNKPGAGSTLASAALAQAVPDGYTLGLATSTLYGIDQQLYKARYKATDFTPVTRLTVSPLILAVNKNLNVSDIKTLVAKARAQQGKFNYSSSGIGGSPHLAGLQFEKATGVKMTHVPYKGGAPALQAVAAGEVELSFGTAASVLPMGTQGVVKMIGVTTPKPSAVAPGLPALAEMGLPGFDFTFWFGLYGPAGLPDGIRDKLFAATAKVMADPQLRAKLASNGSEVSTSASPAEFGKWAAADGKSAVTRIEQAGVKLD
ncbi:extra-cytoplasmic solute receptor BugT [Cupriavidus necator N-1]|uniref:Extra-cytoplasmic solute receptor BugT n=1 Tax=Cupriavidus necator (strain ATCC 43291 / DSM 13513 / CCUG 52238 / LMG 8453 / N-1) TaxID=1042878 RepID=F8GQI6_CUPNN|nr:MULTISPECIES: tripartite tricarboxylate transporter substrate binding protein [Cupriavidus]AEI79458.1 extra-cytoplasmic solute receptor BugT [Cupriavidus necator N-1]EYS97330.1 ABC transporter substrate-binding protein [Cupriavidus sp. SK-4]KAI3601832.1 BUG/TctC family periplasmic protein [Cupriavidus necator H850]MDX6010906.1 tripartite tricarboxylate transporter substrate binding protein [Cupriavidus necator]